VKLILPWSTPSMRFCTSELKTDIICRDLVRRFPGQTILSATGIRRQESSHRDKAPIARAQPKLTSAKHQTTGLDWNPILEWSLDDVLNLHHARGFPLHEAYTKYGSSRVSCAFCIMGSRADLLAATTCSDNDDLYREMVRLETLSTFAFQSGWLGDVAPSLLSDDLRAGVARAKAAAATRERLEAQIPPHLLYTKGWPTCIPTAAEARLLCDVRAGVAEAVGLTIGFTEPGELIARYRRLYEQAH
jgi:3'-phosphoadenosine 5'-phosphosulfate sulfotransferase (PAPS reductase)/FAD synthetase